MASFISRSHPFSTVKNPGLKFNGTKNYYKNQPGINQNRMFLSKCPLWSNDYVFLSLVSKGGIMKQAPVFDEIYEQYLSDLSAVDLTLAGSRLGISVDGNETTIPFYSIPHRISSRGVMDAEGKRPIHAVSVILCKYLLLCPEQEPPAFSEWVRYHSFPDAAPYAEGFRNTAEQPVSKAFSGKLDDLKRACMFLGGQPGEAPYSCDLAIRFPVLPKVNLLMLFNDQDDEFPAECSILFENHADAYLDMECLAMLGMVLAVWLKNGPEYRDGNI